MSAASEGFYKRNFNRPAPIVFTGLILVEMTDEPITLANRKQNQILSVDFKHYKSCPDKLYKAILGALDIIDNEVVAIYTTNNSEIEGQSYWGFPSVINEDFLFKQFLAAGVFGRQTHYSPSTMM